MQANTTGHQPGNQTSGSNMSYWIDSNKQQNFETYPHGNVFPRSQNPILHSGLLLERTCSARVRGFE